MHCLLTLTILSFTASYISALGSEGFDPTCQTHYTQGYGYRLYFDIPPSSFLNNGSFQFHFALSGSSNGHILLAEKTNPYPAYEVVIGGGMNTFSELRKYVNTLSKAEIKVSQMTNNILNPDEIRNFTISSIDGTVTLLSRNNKTEKVILLWKDPKPLDLKYVSFCAWTGVFISWYYDCKGLKLAALEMSTYNKLKNTVLKGYDPYSIPVHHGDTLVLNISIGGLHHINLDVKKSLLTTHGKFNFSWYDYRIKWNPEDYDNITCINLLHREIWLPEFTLENSKNDGTSPMGKAIVRITYTGVISWSPEAQMTTWCSLDLKEWPFDKHSCKISLGLFSYPESVYLTLTQGIPLELSLRNMEWDVTSASVETTTIVDPWKSNRTLDATESHKAVLLKVEMTRKSSFYVYSYFFPVIGSVLIIFASFWLPVFCSKRLLLHTTCLLLLLCNILSLDMALPALTSSTPHIICVDEVGFESANKLHQPYHHCTGPAYMEIRTELTSFYFCGLPTEEVSVSCYLFILATIHIIVSSFFMATYKIYQSSPPKIVSKVVTNQAIKSLFCLFGEYSTMSKENILSEDYKTDSSEMNHYTLFGIMIDRVIFCFSMLYICIILIL